MNKKILVSGGTGYLAVNLITMLKDTACHIVRLGRIGAKFAMVSGKARVEDLIGDICKRTTWEQALQGVDLVYHFAAQTSVYVANENPAVDLESNVLPMLHLLETCRSRDIGAAVVFSGTVTEAGIPSRLPMGETHPDHPVTIYDLHKLMAEHYLKYYANQGMVSGVSLRLANVYGPGPRSSSADRGVLNQMVRKALRGEPLTVYGTGGHVRDYVYIDDVTRAFLAAGVHSARLNGQHFVIGSGQGHTIAEAAYLVAERVAMKIGQHVSVRHIEPPQPQSPIEVRNFVANTTRFAQTTGWQACISLVEGIDRTIEAFLTEEHISS